MRLLAFAFILFLTSCSSSKKMTQKSIYFKNFGDSSIILVSKLPPFTFNSGDLLSISIATQNENIMRILNPAISGGGSAELTSGSSYLVGDDGTIMMPLLGRLNVKGKTKAELQNFISDTLKSTVVNDAIVSVRLLNFRITVLGEVARPSSYHIPNEQLTLLEAIGLAGDLTPFARRDNIKIFRNTPDGEKTMYTVDINEGNIFNKEYFFLKNGDVLYVEMNEKKLANIDQTSMRTFTIIMGVVSAISIVSVALSRF